MSMFVDVFNRASIYEMLFFNVKSVLKFPTLELLNQNNNKLYERWEFLSKSKYDNNPSNKSNLLESEKIYAEKAIYLPEFNKIVAITYAVMEFDNGKMNRKLKKISGDNESDILKAFFDELNQISYNDSLSSPKKNTILCGYNIINYDIPLLIKKFIEHNEDNNQLPFLLKNSLTIKPWESGVIDIKNVWKFNGIGETSLMLISDYMQLKRTVELLPLNEITAYYYNNLDTKKAIDYITLQSATETNLCIQIINKLRML